MGIDPDLSSGVSADLAVVIETEIDRRQDDGPATIGIVLESMYKGLVRELVASGQIDADQDGSLFGEIKSLIEQFGGDALAIDFAKLRASDPLAVVIQAELDNHAENDPPTLGTVRDSMHGGLVANLVGAGAIDPDDDETLLGEITRLIRKHGQDAPAEEFLP